MRAFRPAAKPELDALRTWRGFSTSKCTYENDSKYLHALHLQDFAGLAHLKKHHEGREHDHG